MSDSSRFPSLFLPHGGGPWPLMDGEFLHAHDRLAKHLRELDASLGMRPRAILIVSAHWDAAVATINAGAHPPMLYDYFGFPEHTYRVRYAAPGSPVLAAHIHELLDAAGIPNAIDDERGYDHGVFVPLMIAYPDADISVVQLSLRTDMDPQKHLAIGRALASLRDDGVLIVASGMSFHNMRAFRDANTEVTQVAAEFDRWLAHAITQPDANARDAAIARWADAPGARTAHPTPKHLVPLFVAAGAAAGDPATRTFEGELLGYPVSGFRFG